MVDAVLRLIDTIVDRRVERRRLPVRPAPCLVRAFPDCPYQNCSCAENPRTGPHLVDPACSVHCMPSCSYPKCVQP